MDTYNAVLTTPHFLTKVRKFFALSRKIIELLYCFQKKRISVTKSTPRKNSVFFKKTFILLKGIFNKIDANRPSSFMLFKIKMNLFTFFPNCFVHHVILECTSAGKYSRTPKCSLYKNLRNCNKKFSENRDTPSHA